jgi:hypothetical protein
MSLAIIAANSSSLRRLLPQKQDLHPRSSLSISCVHSVYQNLSEVRFQVVEQSVFHFLVDRVSEEHCSQPTVVHASTERSAPIGEAGIDIIGLAPSMPYFPGKLSMTPTGIACRQYWRPPFIPQPKSAQRKVRRRFFAHLELDDVSHRARRLSGNITITGARVMS